ncbi:MAG: penicillin-binding protein activator [Gammaproteobacteria bacterium]|nr:penicillin-binding protein activator [Gammaproteobacteria bacterium]
MRLSHWIILTPCAMLFAIGCASTPTTSSPGEVKAKIEIKSEDDITVSQAEAMIANGQLADAALIYNKVADTKSTPKREELKFKAIRLMVRSGNSNEARHILMDMDINIESPLYPEVVLLDAKIHINDRNPEMALSRLAHMESQLPDYLKIDFLQTRIEALKLTNNYQEAGLQHIALHGLLELDDQRRTNEQSILANFTLLSDKDLKTLLNQVGDTVTKGWIELARHIIKNKDPLRLSAIIDNWQRKYINHPASSNLLESLAPPNDNTPPDLSKIALLLPMEGTFGNAGKAVRDGFLSAFYHDTNRQTKPTIQIYDTSSKTPIADVYNRAISEGATIVIGPLDKKKISELTTTTDITTPTLALNHLENEEFFTANLFQFGLSPEDEAKQIAQRAWFDGHNKAAMIYPEGNWGERVSAAFKQHWEQLGGRIASEQHYPAQKNDFSAAINKLLNIDQSKERKKKLASLLKAKMRFEPRRREDIDFIFMGAFPRQARLIPPQLKFFNAGDLPLYTTSHSFSGKVDRSADRDMNKVIIGDMPWTLRGNKASPVRKTVYKTFRKDVGKYSRLYALGVDAHNVIYFLNWLRSNTNARLNGATGTIHMTTNNRLARDLTWARFSRGKPEVLALTPTLPSL